MERIERAGEREEEESRPSGESIQGLLVGTRHV
jgi:hypothetical protein